MTSARDINRTTPSVARLSPASLFGNCSAAFLEEIVHTLPQVHSIRLSISLRGSDWRAQIVCFLIKLQWFQPHFLYGGETFSQYIEVY